MHAAPASSLLAGYYVISLRPVGAHVALRRAAAHLGARTFALSPWRIVQRDGEDVRAALQGALEADIAIFTSPPAVVAAAALGPLTRRDGQDRLAVGAGTAAALAAHGVAARAPARMDSEGLLALLPAAQVAGRSVGLVTAPGGRGMIAATLEAAGARLRRADVYARVPVRPSPRRLAALQALPDPWLLPLSSGEALTALLACVPDPVAARLRRSQVLAASARLGTLARALGFDDVRIACDARPGSLLAAAQPVRSDALQVS